MTTGNPEFEAAALFVVQGEVQPNHGRSLGSLLRYDKSVVVTTAELEEDLTAISMPSPDDGGVQYRADRALWVRDWAADTHGLAPYSYDVHFVRPQGDDYSAENRHWGNMVDSVARENKWDPDFSPGRDAILWKYTPFRLSDPGVTLVEMDGELTPAALDHSFLNSSMTPSAVNAKAVASLDPKRGTLRRVEVTFGYPVRAELTREWKQPGITNAQGDSITRVTEKSKREFKPEIPADVQARIDQITSDVNAQRAAQLKAHGDDMFTDEAGHEFYDRELAKRLAPIYNSL